MTVSEWVTAQACVGDAAVRTQRCARFKFNGLSSSLNGLSSTVDSSPVAWRQGPLSLGM